MNMNKLWYNENIFRYTGNYHYYVNYQSNYAFKYVKF